MGLLSRSGDNRTREERRADLNRYRALREAGNQAAKNLREEGPTTNGLNDAIVEAEQDVPWWRR